ncbi:MAG: sialate O-acetylesterase, partial [Pirellulaceae bacterium]
VGGSQIALWQKGAKLYDEALRRADLALQQTAAVRGQIRGVLWLQGEADATEDRLPLYEGKLFRLIDDLRNDLQQPGLPFIAATIGEMRDPASHPQVAAINRILLSLPDQKTATGCVDGRYLKTHSGDYVHFDTAAQMEIGRRYAAQYRRLTL